MKSRLARTIVIVFAILLALVVTGCESGPITPTRDVQTDRLITFIVSDWASGGSTGRFIALLSAEPQNLNVPLSIYEGSIRQCWFAQGGKLEDCTSKDWRDSFSQEQLVPWKHSYVVFALVSVSQDYSRAVVRLDENFGPKAETGYLITLVQVDGQWREESRKLVSWKHELKS